MTSEARADGPVPYPSVVVAMLTYRRVDELPAAILAVLEQVKSYEGAASVLIVDNDPDGAAMPLADSFDASFVTFVHEARPGIPAARNRALDEAGDNQLLVFIDDDERPEPNWLANLIGAWADFGSASVAGRVVSVFEGVPEPWITEGGFFERRTLPTGSSIETAATNNLLLDLATVRRLLVRFDDRFRVSGGSDTLFTRQLHQLGGPMVWCDEAVVLDRVPKERLERRWVLLRSMRYGNSASKAELVMSNGFLEKAQLRVVLAASGLARILFGLGRFLWGTGSRSVRDRSRGLRTIARGIGLIGGSVGYSYNEYRRPRPASKDRS